MRAPKATSNKQVQVEDNQTLKEALSKPSHRGYWIWFTQASSCVVSTWCFIATHCKLLTDKTPASSATAGDGLRWYLQHLRFLLLGRNGRQVQQASCDVCTLLGFERWLSVRLSLYQSRNQPQRSSVLQLASVGLVQFPLAFWFSSSNFGARYLSTLYGLVFFTHQVGSFLGAWVGTVCICDFNTDLTNQSGGATVVLAFCSCAYPFTDQWQANWASEIGNGLTFNTDSPNQL